MPSSTFKRLDKDISVAAQLDAADFARARQEGFATIINNRPDGEAADQLPSAEAEILARAEGLDYVHVPVISGGLTLEDIAAMRDALANARQPVLAYCRTGTRSCNLWALALAPERSVEDLLDAAAGAGYDLTGIAGTLRQLHARGTG